MLARWLKTISARVIVAACAFLMVAAAATADGRVALVVGNSAYEHVSTLPNPRNDAAAIQSKLEELGFDVIASLDADRSRLRADLDRFTEEAASAEIALIFYAGHGLQISGENYLLPVDAAISAPTDLNTTAIRASDLYQAFLEAQPELAILILDACRNNPLSDALGTTPGLTSGSVSPREFVQQPESAGMIIAFAAAPGAVAYDGTDGNSPYTTALLQWIDRPGLELGTMFRKVRGTVLDITQGAQVPWVEEALLREVYLNPIDPSRIAEVVDGARIELALLETIRALDDPAEQAAAVEFYDRFVVAPEEDATVQRASLNIDTPLSREEDFAQQGLIWLSIRKSDDPEVFRAFLNYFPQSPFEDLARSRIEDLEDAGPVEVFAELDIGNFGAATDAGVPLASLPSPDGATGLPAGTSPASPSGLVDSLTAATTPLAEVQPPRSPAETEAALNFGTEERAAVQALLAQAGLYRGALDADYGPGTRGAIGQFQARFGLTETGYLDIPTLRSLVRQAARPVLLGELPAARRDAVHRVSAVAARGPGAVPRTIHAVSIRRNDSVHTLLREVADEFEATHPGFRVEFSFPPGVDYRVRLMSMLGSGTPPDILYTWGGGHLEALVESGFARDLTDDLAGDWALEFRPGGLQNYVFDGRVYGVPMHMSLISLWVNRRVMAEAGLPLDDLDTWEGLLRTVAALKAQGRTPIAIGGGDEWPYALYWAALAQQIGGADAFREAYAGQGDGFAGPAFVEAGAEFRRLAELDPFQAGFEDMDDGQAVEVFSRGEAAMVLTGNWRLQKMRWTWAGGRDAMRTELARLPFPSVDGRTAGGTTYGGVDGFAVNADAPDEAVDLLRMIASRQVQQELVELASDVPTISGADISLEDPFLQGVARELLETGYHQLYYDQALGPVAGATLIDVAKAIGLGEMTGLEAATRLDAVWDELLVRGGETDFSPLPIPRE